MNHTLAIAIAALSLGLVTPLAAQAPPPTDDPAPPAAGTAPSERQTPADRQRNSAAKLAGMIRFVATSCPDAEPNYDRFKSVIANMRVDIKDLESGPLMATSLGYSRAYEKEPAESCKRAFERFGETGTTIPGLIAKKAPQTDAPAEPQAK